MLAPSYLLNKLRNFSEIFMKDVTNENIKRVTKNQESTFSLKKHIFGKTAGVVGVKLISLQPF